MLVCTSDPGGRVFIDLSPGYAAEVAVSPPHALGSSASGSEAACARLPQPALPPVAHRDARSRQRERPEDPVRLSEGKQQCGLFLALHYE